MISADEELGEWSSIPVDGRRNSVYGRRCFINWDELGGVAVRWHVKASRTPVCVTWAWRAGCHGHGRADRRCALSVRLRTAAVVLTCMDVGDGLGGCTRGGLTCR